MRHRASVSVGRTNYLLKRYNLRGSVPPRRAPHQIEEREGNTDIKIIILVLEGHYDSYELTPEASPYKDSGRSESEVGGVSESYKNNPGDPTLGGGGSEG